MAIKANGEKIEYWAIYPVAQGAASTDVANVGDLMWWDNTNFCARPATYFTWSTDAPTTRRLFKRWFVGVNYEQRFAQTTPSPASPNLTVKVLQSGRFNCDQASATLVPAQLIGPDSASNKLMNQQVIAVQDPAEAIGESSRYYGSAVGQVDCFIWSNYEAYYQRRSSSKLVFQYGYWPAVGAWAPDETNIINGATAYELFGGAAEILASYFIVGTILSVADGNLLITTTAGDLTVLNIPNASAAGAVVRQSHATDANRIMTANDTLILSQEGIAPSTGGGLYAIEYRPLS